MAINDLRREIARLPAQPGVYLYFNRAGETIYVGRARALRDRVRSYLGAYGNDPKTDALLDEAARLEVIVTDSVVEALALENNLIKQRSPRYNILLRDDKNYPYLQLTTGEAFPRVLVARSVARDGHYYAGPFLPATFARKTMSLTHRLFGIRSCNEVITGKRDRPCLEYDIKRCVAPCVAEVCGPDRYAESVKQTRLFLEGKTDEVVGRLRRQMEEASAAQEYERAAQCRDAMRTVETLRDRQQKMATAQLGDRDAFGMKTGPAGAVIQVFQVRRGRVVERVELAADGDDVAAAGNEPRLVAAAVQQFYAARDVPPEVHVPVEVEDREAIEAWLSERAGRSVRVRTPKRGDRRALLDLASRNAGLAYDARYSENARIHAGALTELQHVLGLPQPPIRVECFDISTFQGRETVGSMVVCDDGRMQRSEYRKFRVQGLGARGGRRGSRGKGHPRQAAPEETERRSGAGRAKPDDFAAMHEVVFRRYRRLMEEGGPFPDLVVVDGGQGQLTAAYRALDTLGLGNLVVIGLAKREEEIYTRGGNTPVRLPKSSPALHLVQRARDEAHRFAVTFHRRARAMRDFHSELDLIPGIGPRRRRALLERFGSLANVRRATREELLPVVGPKLADVVLAFFTRITTVSI
ncbi:MAG: excinuclease ABC subunit UvrC [Acidobacteria bacterium]|nr:excinuclease ABC subunit UvrC [Acidobacteriota bacterium]MXZ70294.1 excinuclease ABC subunit UvrC [Acidobacteriota bacterium]MYD69690.1 excinuclease ABC subunit UvrC [Acidobacteriota bacterium]MYJ03565.1 excinuclease ABC subunit UvrC [Acidobacteriota bacterium]